MDESLDKTLVTAYETFAGIVDAIPSVSLGAYNTNIRSLTAKLSYKQATTEQTGFISVGYPVLLGREKELQSTFGLLLDSIDDRPYSAIVNPLIERLQPEQLGIENIGFDLKADEKSTVPFSESIIQPLTATMKEIYPSHNPVIALGGTWINWSTTNPIKDM